MTDRLNDFSQRYMESWTFGRFAPFSRSKCLFCTNTVKHFKHKRREKCFILSKHTYPCTKFLNGIPRKYFLDKLYVESSKVVDMSSEKVIIDDTNINDFNLNSNLDFNESNGLKR